ncbi:hypothetical protein JCM11491_002618 [Sporobolomyces phaffii]
MSRSTRLHTLCAGGAFGGLFGGRSTDTDATTASASATTPTSASTATSAANSPNANTLASTSSPLTTASAATTYVVPLAGGGYTTMTSDPYPSSSTSHSRLSAYDVPDWGTTSVYSPTSRVSQVIVTVTSIVTNADGSHSTMEVQSASAVALKQDSSGPSGKTWGIIGGVIGGVAVLVGAILVFWRCTQRRFDSLDGGMDEIKWPELQPDGQNVSAGLSTLNPAATRRTGRAGIEMEKDDGSEWGDDSPRLGSRPGANDGQYFDNIYENPFTDSNGIGPAGAGGEQRRGSYYDDPFQQGQAATPYPPRRPLSNLPYGQYDAAVSNASFRTSHMHASNEQLPLVGNTGPGGSSGPGGVPVLRVSSPESHRHF